MCRFLSILYKTYDQIFFKYMFNLNSIFLNKITPYYSFYHTYQGTYGTVLAVRYRYQQVTTSGACPDGCLPW